MVFAARFFKRFQSTRIRMALSTKTKRLIIRPYEVKDIKAWQDAYAGMYKAQNSWDLNPRVLKDLTPSNFKKLLKVQKEQRAKETFYDFAVFLKDTGELIGTVALMDISRGVFQNAYLGYRIFNKHWNKGYGKEMVAASFQLAFKDLKLHRVEAGIDPKNRRSILLARSVGMRKEGLKKKALYLNNVWQDIGIYSLTCDEFGIKFRGDLKAMSVPFFTPNGVFIASIN
jgi:ribosomal-protein-alanine N-acetyltransferase